MPLDTEMAAVDFSSARPAPRDLWNAGYRIVLRYLARDWRQMSTQELAGYHSVGLFVGVFCQSTIERPLSGRAGGREDAARYNRWADQDRLPASLPLIYVVDVGKTESTDRGFPDTRDLPVIREFFSGILESAGRPVAAYGPYPVLEALKAVTGGGRTISHFIQTAGGSGFGEGTGGSYHDPADGSGWNRRISDAACMIQMVGGQRIMPIGSTDHVGILNRAHAFGCAYHPAFEAPTPEKIMTKCVFLPDHTGGVGWQPTVDGNGRLRRLAIPSLEALAMLKQVGVLDGEVELRGVHADAFLERFTEANGSNADMGALTLTGVTVGRVAEAVEKAKIEILARVGQITSPALPADFAHQVAADLIDEIGEAVDAGLADLPDRVVDLASQRLQD